MDISHAIAIIIKGKNLAGPPIKEAGEQVSLLSKVVRTAGLGLTILGKGAIVAGYNVERMGVRVADVRTRYELLNKVLKTVGTGITSFGEKLGGAGIYLQKLGVGLIAYSEKMGTAAKVTEETEKAVKDLSETAEKAGNTLAKLGKVATTVLVAGLAGVTAGAALLGTALAAVGTALTVGLDKLTRYAAGLDLMRDAMWGIAGDAAPAMMQSLREASAFMIVEKGLIRAHAQAYMLVGDIMTEKLPEAMRYLTKVAAATGDSAEFLMERLTRSIGRLSTRWMAYIGTVVPIEEATARAVEMFGKEADALTYAEKQAGMLDRTLEKLRARTSALPEVMGTAKQMGDALRVTWKELGTDIATMFLPAAKSMYEVLTRIGNAFRRVIAEGGALYKPIRTLSAAISVLYDLFGEFIDRTLELEDVGVSALENFANKAIHFAWEAFSWGANIAVNLASGLVKGASVALTGAMNFIGNLLASWLAPGSAPRVVSNIGDWGAAAFTEFLRGFSMAQFDVLEGVQRPLKRALGVLVKLEEIDVIQAGESFIGLSESLAASIAEFGRTGEISSDIFNELSEATGGYGESLAELLRRQLDLATSMERLAAAEERVRQARIDEEKANVALSKSAREYNKLALEGASPAVLKAKLAEVEASYDSLVAAREETKVAEEAEEAAKEEVKRQKEQVRLQERLLNQLIAMGEAMADLIDARREDAEDDDAYVLPPIEFPEFHVPPIDVAFQELKDRIRTMFLDLWADLRTQWDESGVGQAVQELQDRWERFRTETLTPLREKLGEIYANFKTWVGDEGWPWVLEQWDKWSAWWDEHGQGITDWLLGIGDSPLSYKNLWNWVLEEWDEWRLWWDTDGPIITEAIDSIGTGVTNLLESLGIDLTGTGGGGWRGIWGIALKILEGTVESSQILMEGWMEELRNTITLGAQLINKDWEGAQETLWDIFTTSWDTLNRLTDGGLNKLQRTISEWVMDPSTLFLAGYEILNRLNAGMQEGLERLVIWMTTGLFADLSQLLQDVNDWLVGALQQLADRVVEGIALIDLASLGWNIIQGLMDGLWARDWEVSNALYWIIQNAIAAAMNVLGAHSRSEVFFDLGENVAQSFAAGVESLGTTPALPVTDLMNAPLVDMGPGRRRGGGNTYYITNHFNKDSIRSDADVIDIANAQQQALELQGVRGRIS